MSTTGKTYGALVGAPLLVAITAWFDTRFMSDAMRRAAGSFDMSGVSALTAVGSVLVAGGVLIVGVLAWRAASSIVSLMYALVGGFFVMLPWLVWTLAAQRNDVPPVLPDPLARWLGDIYRWTLGGPLNATGTIGGAMLIAGIVTLVRWQRLRSVAGPSVASIVPAVDPTHR
jgi:hypothetical protein